MSARVEPEWAMVTILFVDIRGFTTFADRSTAREAVDYLNEFFQLVIPIVTEHGGHANKLLGDGLLGVFGAPGHLPDHADRALAAAQSMHIRQAEVNRRWEDAGLPAFHLGIGLSTGKAAAALLGSEERLEYTLVGDTVNLAQRLQQWAAEGEIVLSQASVDALSAPVESEELEPATVKGRQAPVYAYRIAKQGASA